MQLLSISSDLDWNTSQDPLRINVVTSKTWWLRFWHVIHDFRNFGISHCESKLHTSGLEESANNSLGIQISQVTVRLSRSDKDDRLSRGVGHGDRRTHLQ